MKLFEISVEFWSFVQEACLKKFLCLGIRQIHKIFFFYILFADGKIFAGVVGLFGVKIIRIVGPVAREFYFRIRIVLGTTPNWFLVIRSVVRGCSPNSSGECLHLCVQENLVEFRQRTQNAGLSPADFLGQLFLEPCPQSPQKPAWCTPR